MVDKRALAIAIGLMVGLFFLVYLPVAEAQPAATAGELSVTVIKVEGRVDVRLSPREKWIPAKVKMVLKVGGEVSTGAASRVELLLATGGDPTLVAANSLTWLKIDKHLRTANTIRTKLGLKFGSVQAAVLPTSLETDFQIKTPALTASVRGSEYKEVRHYPDKCTEIWSGKLNPDHQMEVSDSQGREQKLGSDEETDCDLTHPVDNDKNDQNKKELPEGSTDDEDKWAGWLPDPSDTNPGEVQDGDAHPEIDRPSGPEDEDGWKPGHGDSYYKPPSHDGYYNGDGYYGGPSSARKSALGYPFLLVPILVPVFFTVLRRRRRR